MQFLNLTGPKGAGLTCYILNPRPERSPDRSPRPGILIVPGGAYCENVDHEQECLALQFMAQGYHAFVLHYAVHREGEPHPGSIPLEQAAWAMALLREKAEDWNLDPCRLAAAGFSAGGHLAAGLAVHWNKAWLRELTGLTPEQMRPDALILGYPVITAGALTHKETIYHLLGPSPTPEETELCSLEKQVDAQTPPCFLWTTQEDELVPPENTLLFAQACVKNHVPVELHFFPWNRHGLSLASHETAWDGPSDDSHVAAWLPLCFRWLEILFG